MCINEKYVNFFLNCLLINVGIVVLHEDGTGILIRMSTS